MELKLITNTATAQRGREDSRTTFKTGCESQNKISSQIDAAISSCLAVLLSIFTAAQIYQGQHPADQHNVSSLMPFCHYVCLHFSRT
ncbi:Hypothetical predicted protein [Xyrichtys novacula]|uniref:Uncharacterized protein n=1 Tax=Xyrichtys novacula TaxID=13765 RepID=A0AAV1EWA4_XYRNO|nr:Hypothetical predicted protein [Xyrichtys novacula]